MAKRHNMPARKRAHPSSYLRQRGFAGEETAPKEKSKSAAGLPLMIFTIALLGFTVANSPKR